MNYFWYLLLLAGYYFLFWKVLYLLLGLPSILSKKIADKFISGEIINRPKIVIIIYLIEAHIFGVLISSVIYGAIASAITWGASSQQPSVWPYYIIGAIFAFFIIAPTGETSLIAMMESLISYVIFICLFSKGNLFAHITLDLFLSITSYIILTVALFFIYFSIKNDFFRNFFDKMPNWLRWMLFLPFALISMFLVEIFLAFLLDGIYVFYPLAIAYAVIYLGIVSVIVFLHMIYSFTPKQNYIITLIVSVLFIIYCVSDIIYYTPTTDFVDLSSYIIKPIAIITTLTYCAILHKKELTKARTANEEG